MNDGGTATPLQAEGVQDFASSQLFERTFQEPDLAQPKRLRFQGRYRLDLQLIIVIGQRVSPGNRPATGRQ